MLTTFIIPSKGRPTLANTLCSLYEQQHIYWNAIVCFDAVEPTIQSNKRIHVIKTPTKLGVGVNGAGNVRNYAVKYGKDNNLLLGRYISWVDDDDTVNNTYTRYLRTLGCQYNTDIIIFSMLWPNGRIIPRDANLTLEQLENDIGISFSCRKEVFDKIQFVPDSGEDYQFLKRAKDAGFSIHISSLVEYLVCPLGIPPDRR